MKLASVHTLHVIGYSNICFKSADPSSNPTRSKKIQIFTFFHNFHINTLHIMHTRCPIRNCGLVFISCIFRQLWMGISQTYQEIQSCHWHDNNWEIGEGTPNHWPSEHYSLFVALATFLAVWSWREWHHRTSSRDDLQPYGKAPIVASTLLMSRSHWHHGICMSLSCFGWLPIVKEGKRFFVQLWWYIQFRGSSNLLLHEIMKYLWIFEI